MTKVACIAMSSSQSPLIMKVSTNPLLQKQASPSGSAPTFLRCGPGPGSSCKQLVTSVYRN